MNWLLSAPIWLLLGRQIGSKRQSEKDGYPRSSSSGLNGSNSIEVVSSSFRYVMIQYDIADIHAKRHNKLKKKWKFMLEDIVW